MFTHSFNFISKCQNRKIAYGNYLAVVTSQYFLFKNLIKGYHKSLVFLAYLRYFLYLYTYERASYGHIKSAARHDGRDAVDA